MRFEMKMPDLATTNSDVRIVRWMIEPGQQVQRGQQLLEVETDKATMEVENTAGAVIPAVPGQTPEEASPATPFAPPVKMPVTAAGDGRGTLSVDHRVASGRYAGDFLEAIVKELESFRVQRKTKR
jgi:pyruvate/2-oxoglutarate dehydrogenase complex dihydrolipoamide acyltransferase (E2) component